MDTTVVCVDYLGDGVYGAWIYGTDPKEPRSILHRGVDPMKVCRWAENFTDDTGFVELSEMVWEMIFIYA